MDLVLFTRGRRDRLRLTGARAKVLCRLLRRTEQVLVNSRAGRDYLEQEIGVDASQILYAANWIDPAFLEQARGRAYAAEPHTFGCVARFDEVKQLELLIEALPIVQRRVPKARLVLQGEGPAKAALAAQAAQLGATNAVEFVAAGPEVTTTLSRLRCFTLPSKNEGLPNAAIEALAMGVPLVANAAGDVTDLIEPNRTGVVIQGDGAEAVANAIVTCLENEALATACKTAGPELVAAGYSMDAGLARLIPAYESLIPQPAS